MAVEEDSVPDIFPSCHFQTLRGPPTGSPDHRIISSGFVRCSSALPRICSSDVLPLRERYSSICIFIDGRDSHPLTMITDNTCTVVAPTRMYLITSSPVMTPPVALMGMEIAFRASATCSKV